MREYIEQRERDLTLGPDTVDVSEEVKYIRFMFENVREDIEANRPDRFIGLGGPKHNHLSAGPSGLALPAGSTNALSMMNTGKGRVDSGLSDGLYRMKEKVDGLQKDGEAYGSTASSEAQKVIESKEAELRKEAEDKIRESGDLEKDIESNGRQTVEKKVHEAEVRATDTAGRIQATLEVKDPFREEKRDD